MSIFVGCTNLLYKPDRVEINEGCAVVTPFQSQSIASKMSVSALEIHIQKEEEEEEEVEEEVVVSGS